MDAGGNASVINNISPEFTQEVKIQTSNPSSEYGRSSGAVFNVEFLFYGTLPAWPPKVRAA